MDNNRIEKQFNPQHVGVGLCPHPQVNQNPERIIDISHLFEREFIYISYAYRLGRGRTTPSVRSLWLWHLMQGPLQFIYLFWG